MKAVRIHDFGGSEQVKLEDLPMPNLEKGKALVRIHAAAVNPVDWMVREQIYNPSPLDQVPLTLGQDFAGVIEQIGPNTQTSFKVGDEVFGEVWGAFAQYALVPIEDLVLKPKSVDFVTAASIPMPAITAWQAVIDTAQARPGMKLLIHGVSGGVGSFAAQFAKWKGATVIGTASPESFDWLRSIGVDELIDYKAERFEDKVKDVDVVLDPVGGDTQERSFKVLKKSGMLIGFVGLNEAAARRAGINGVEFGMEYDTEDLREIVRLVEQGIVKPHISEVMPMDKAREALDLNQEGKSHGKVVLEVP
jgi:NADPH:quinone reductase-like Zn-dependent oxidoreductase